MRSPFKAVTDAVVLSVFSKRRLLLVVGMLLAGFAPSVQAATYYISTNGNDSTTTPGTEAAPFKTVQRAVNVIMPGDTVIIRAGRHAPFRITGKHGTAGSPMTFRGERGAIIDRHLGGPSFFRSIELTDVSYITIDGLELTDTNPFIPKACVPGMEPTNTTPLHERAIQNGIKINLDRNGKRAHHLVLQNLDIHHSRAHTILGAMDDSQVLNNHLHDNGLRRPDGVAIGQSYGTYLTGRRLVISGNRIHHNTGHGIRTSNIGAESVLVDSIIENNVIYNNGGRFEHTPRQGEPCIVVDGGHGIRLYHGSGNIVRNNVIYSNNGGGIGLNENHTVSPLPNRIYNNTVFNNGFAKSVSHPGIQVISSGGPGKTSIILNNIVYGNAGKAIEGVGPGVVQSNNLTTDPKFADAARGNFRLKSDSPGIDQGANLLPLVSTDISGAKRPQGTGFDIGAYEFGTTGPQPAPPTDFEVK